MNNDQIQEGNMDKNNFEFFRNLRSLEDRREISASVPPAVLLELDPTTVHGTIAAVKQEAQEPAAQSDEVRDALQKIRAKVHSATICHPNAVSFLLDDALGLIDAAIAAAKCAGERP